MIAEQEAIATGLRGKLLDLTIKLKDVEKERRSDNQKRGEGTAIRRRPAEDSHQAGGFI